MERINQIQEAVQAASQAFSARMQGLATSLPPADISRVMQVRQPSRA